MQKTIRDAFVEKLVTMARQAKLGDPSKAETQVGPVTTPPQYQKILPYIDIAKNEGARCVLGGGPATKQEGGGKYSVKPTIFAKMRIAKEEVFMAKRIPAGTVWVNTYRAVSFLMPFGGRPRGSAARTAPRQAAVRASIKVESSYDQDRVLWRICNSFDISNHPGLPKLQVAV